MAAELKQVLIKSKLEDANRLLAVAESELESAMKTLLSGRGDEKTLVATVLQAAFDKLRGARLDVAALEKLLDEPASP